MILEKDKDEYVLNADMMDCLQDDTLALKHFQKLPKSHQNYYSKYIDSAKTDVTRAKRIAQVLYAMQHGLTYAEMIRASRMEK